MDEPKTTRVSLDFTDEDMEVLEDVKKMLEKEHGKVPNSTAIRTALRRMLKEVSA